MICTTLSCLVWITQHPMMPSPHSWDRCWSREPVYAPSCCRCIQQGVISSWQNPARDGVVTPQHAPQLHRSCHTCVFMHHHQIETRGCYRCLGYATNLSCACRIVQICRSGTRPGAPVGTTRANTRTGLSTSLPLNMSCQPRFSILAQYLQAQQ